MSGFAADTFEPRRSKQETSYLEEKNSVNFNLSGLYRPSLVQSNLKKKPDLKGLKERFLQDIHPHIKESIQNKRLNFRLKKNFTLEDAKLLEDFSSKYNKQDNRFNFDGFMTNVEADDYLVDEFEKDLRFNKIHKLRADQNCYLKIIEKDNIGKALVYVDKYPLLLVRKTLMFYWQRIRRACFKLAKHPKFEFLSLLVIVLNSVFILIDDPTTTSSNSLSDQTENLFLVLYSTELVIKLVGFGIYEKKNAFFRDFWNILDFVIVSTSILNIILSDNSINLSALRSLRVLRPLKTISTIKKLKNLILTIFSSIPFLIDILMVLLFAYSVFAIAGLHLFQGVLKKRCWDSIGSKLFIPETMCSDDSICPDGYSCLDQFQNPNYGITNFDNIGYSLLMVFQITTLEGWYVIMDNLRGAFSDILASLTIVYFVFLIFIGNFLILNLVLAVIIVKFNETQALKLEQMVNIVHSKFCQCNSGLNFSHMKLKGYFVEMSNLSIYANKNSTKKFRYVERNKYDELNRQLIFDKTFEFIVSDEMNSQQITLQLSRTGIKNKTQKLDVITASRMKNSWSRLLHKSKIHPLKMKDSDAGMPNMNNSQKMFKSKVERLIFQSRVVKTIRNSIKELENKNTEQIGNQPFRHSYTTFDPKKKVHSIEFKDQNNATENSGLNYKIITPRNLVTSEFDLDSKLQKIHNTDTKKSRFAPREERLDLSSKIENIKRSSISNIKEFDGSDIPSEKEDEFIQTDEKFKKEIIFTEKAVKNVDLGGPPKSKTKMRLSVHKRKKSFYRGYTQNFNRGSNLVARQSLKDLHVFNKTSKSSRLANSTLTSSKIKRKSTTKDIDILLRKNTDHLQINLSLCQNFSSMEYLKQRPEVLPTYIKSVQVEESALSKMHQIRSKLKIFYDLKPLLTIYSQSKKIKSFQSDVVSRGTNNSEFSIKQFDRKDQKLSYSKKKPKNKNMTSSFVTLLTLESNNTNRSHVASPLYSGLRQTLNDYFYIEFKQEVVSRYISNSKLKKIQSHQTIREDTSHQNMTKDCKHKTKNFYQISKYFSQEFDTEYPDKPQNEETEFNMRYLDLFYNTIIERDITSNSINTHVNSINDVISQQQVPIEKISNIFNTLNVEIIYIWLKGITGKLTMLRFHIRKFYESKAIENFFILLVLINTVLLCSSGLLNSDGDMIVSSFMDIITYIFVLEAFTKIFGYGIRNYAKDFFNVFDFLIVCISIAELFIQSDESVLSAIKVVRVLRTFRVLRVTRLLRSLKFMRIIIEVVVVSLEQFIYIALLLLLFIIIFAMLGMQLFAGKFNFYQPGEIKRQNFDSFSDSFLVLFQMMTIENWNDVLVLTYRSDQNFIFSILFLISWIFIGNYILLNLFMAILLDGFSSYSVLHKYRDIEDEFVIIDKIIQTNRQKAIKEKLDFEKRLKPKKVKMSSEGNPNYKLENDTANNSAVSLQESSKSKPEEKDSKADVDINNLHHIHQENESVDSSEDELDNFFYKERAHEKRMKLKTENIFCENSLFFISKNGAFRKKVIRFVTNPKFETVILIIIMLSSIKLVIDTYQDDSWNGTVFLRFLNICDTCFNVIFLIEFLGKIIAYGFLFCEGSYLNDSWNIIDFCIVCTSFVDMVLEQLNLPFLKILRILRTLRPLRFLSTNQNMRIVVSSLIESIGGILNVLVVIFIVWIMFGILGMNLMAGKHGYCNFPDNRNYYSVNMNMCLATGGSWDTWGWNFDNIFNSLVTLFILTSGESWPNVMFSAMDANTPDIGPIRYGNYYIFPYFLLFMLIGSLFLMNLFVGVIFMQFTTEQDNEKKKHFRMVTDDQFKWIIMQKMIENAKPNYNIIATPKNRFRLFIYKIITSKHFESFVLFMIVLNIITLAIVYDNMSDEYSNILEKINLVFTIIFILEAVLKLIAQGFKQYFSITWNQFDFVIVVSSILDIILTNFVDMQSIRVYPQLARIIKILRVTRLFKLMKSQRMQSLNKIIKTLVFAIPALLNVLLLLCLIYFLFSVLGVFLFQSSSAEFANFGTTLLFLFRLSTGEDWPTEMFRNSASSPIFGRLFFLSYIFFSSFVMINMFVLIVIEQFENFYFNPNNPINCFEDIADEFRKTWILFSYKYQGKKIKSNEIYNFFACLPIPLGFHVPLKNEAEDVYTENFNLTYFLSNLRFDPNFIRRKIADMNIYEDNSGYISFGQVLHAAMRNAFGYKCLANAPTDTKRKIRKIELQTVAKIFKDNEVKTTSKTKIGRSRDKKTIKTANPFCNILFAQLTFQIWCNFTKKHRSLPSLSSENLDELLFKNPDYHFNQKVISQIKKPTYLDLDFINQKKSDE